MIKGIKGGGIGNTFHTNFPYFVIGIEPKRCTNNLFGQETGRHGGGGVSPSIPRLFNYQRRKNKRQRNIYSIWLYLHGIQYK